MEASVFEEEIAKPVPTAAFAQTRYPPVKHE